MPAKGSLGTVFDHVGIAVSDLAASERFYRTVLNALGVEPSHADADLGSPPRLLEEEIERTPAHL